MPHNHRTAAESHLILDGGKTKTAAMIVDAEGREVAQATGPGLAIIWGHNGFELVVESLRVTLSALGGPRNFGTVCIGLNGVLQSSESTLHLAVDALRTVTDARRYIIASDVVTTFVGALGITPGVVVAAGTGSVILGLGSDGVPHRVDGNGPFFADRGSGYQVGSRGLDAALRFADGLDGSAALFDQLRERFGGVSEAVRATYNDLNPVQVVASFSRNVVVAADQGDEFAISIWTRAAKDLAQGAAAAATSAGLVDKPFPVAWSGGLFSVGPLLRVPFEAELGRIAPNARVRQAHGNALSGGVRLALEAEPVLTSVSVWVDVSHSPRIDH